MDFKQLLFTTTFSLASCFTVKAQNNDWENPRLIDQGKEKPHVTFMQFKQQKDALADDYSRSANFKSLNGTWKFNYVDQYKDRRTDNYKNY
jgi:beta-galactosidase